MTAVLLALGPALLALAAMVLELRRRAELVARAAHEVRGPLTAASLALHLGARDAVPAELRRAAAAVEDVQRAACGRGPALCGDRVDAAALLDAVAAGAARGADAGRVRVVPGARSAIVRGDGRLLRQALVNLVANALEHGDGDVVLAARRRGGRLRLEVRDAGRGPQTCGRMGAPARLLARLPPGPRAGRAALATLLRAGRHRRGHGLRVAASVAARHGGRLLLAPDAHGFVAVLELPPADDSTAPAPRRGRRRRAPARDRRVPAGRLSA